MASRSVITRIGYRAALPLRAGMTSTSGLRKENRNFNSALARILDLKRHCDSRHNGRYLIDANVGYNLIMENKPNPSRPMVGENSSTWNLK